MREGWPYRSEVCHSWKPPRYNVMGDLSKLPQTRTMHIYIQHQCWGGRCENLKPSMPEQGKQDIDLFTRYWCIQHACRSATTCNLSLRLHHLINQSGIYKETTEHCKINKYAESEINLFYWRSCGSSFNLWLTQCITTSKVREWGETLHKFWYKQPWKSSLHSIN